MASGPSAKQLEIIRRLAAREAARRQAQTAPASSTVQQPAQTTFEEAAVLDAERLEPILCDERAKNDVAWARVCEVSVAARGICYACAERGVLTHTVSAIGSSERSTL